MKIVGLDTETFLIAAGVAAPKLVCVTEDDGGACDIHLAEDGVERFLENLRDPNTIQVIHHAPFDLVVLVAEVFDRDGEEAGRAVLRAVFDAIRAGRLRCTKIREQILENARGELKFDWDEDLGEFKRASFTLERCLWNRCKVFVKKTADTWRKRYGHLAETPLAWWPPEAVEYAKKDATYHRQLFFAQEDAALSEEFGAQRRPDGTADIPGEVATTMTAFCLGLMRTWGVRTDPEMVKVVRAEFQEKFDAAVALARKWKLVGEKKVSEVLPEHYEKYGHLIEKEVKKLPATMKHRVVRPKRDMKRIRDRVRFLYTARGQDVPMSDSGKNIATDRETLTFKRFPSWAKDEGLVAVADVVRYEKLLKTYVPILERGARFPITPDWNAMVETFRISCARPNLTNQPRGTAVRNCFIPRAGFKSFAIADYDTIEMRALAQVCLKLFGYSFLADTLRQGKDVHVMLTADALEMPYEMAQEKYDAGDKEIENARQLCKHANYGLGGGMGAPTFVEYARGFDVVLSLAHAQNLHQAFRRTWREMVDYFKYCSSLCSDDDGDARVVIHPLTGYVRGRVRYTATCNHHFQHPVAVGAKAALCHVVEECYVVEDSPLYGCRPWLFEHDGIALEVPYEGERASTAAERLQEVMVEKMKVVIPDVPVTATVTLGRRWFKGARPVRIDGVLVPSKPEQQNGKTVWVADLGDGYASAAA